MAPRFSDSGHSVPPAVRNKDFIRSEDKLVSLIILPKLNSYWVKIAKLQIIRTTLAVLI